MKKISLWYVIILVCFFSCRSYKDLTYFQDVQDQEMISLLPKDPPDYRIQVEDNLYVSITSNNAELNVVYNPAVSQVGDVRGGAVQMYDSPADQYINGYEVTENGELDLPILGKIPVKDLTLFEAEQRIRERAMEFLKEATVKVRLLSFQFTVLGEVKTPGVYSNFRDNLTVLEAIGMANGNTDYSHIKDILVIRNTNEGTKTFRLDLSTKAIFASEAYYLLPDDVLYVEPDKFKNFQLKAPTISLILSALTVVVLIANLVIN